MNELSDDKKEMLQKKVDPLFEKRDEVNQHCRKFGISYKRFTNGQECSSYKGLSKNSNKLKEQGFKQIDPASFTLSITKIYLVILLYNLCS